VNRIFLVLEDGDIYEGVGVTEQTGDGSTSAQKFPERAGEVVFNTTHSGYEEIATDPSYLHQIVVMTAPMQGNYGTHKEDWESHKVWFSGFVCLQLQQSKSNSGWLKRLVENKIPILTEVDTRALTLKLRHSGTPWGALVQANTSQEALKKAQALIQETKDQQTSKTQRDWVWQASRKEIEDIAGENKNGPRIAILDFGSKENILRELKKRCSVVRVYPARTSAQKILDWKPAGLMLTNGPGDPSLVESAVETVRTLLGQLPVYGICMGHQILGQALGAKTYKLKFGHRGANHPIQDRILNKIYMSSQNHGYAVDDKTLPEHVRVTHINLNDKTVAGIFSEKLNCLGIQYHPESHPGPHEAVELFDFFINQMVLARKTENRNGKTNDYTVPV